MIMAAGIVAAYMLPTPAPTVSNALVGQILGSVVLAALVGAAINGFLNRRKLGAEATEIITKAASSVVSDVRVDNERLRVELGEVKAQVVILTSKVDASRVREEAWQEYARDHDQWDRVALPRLREIDPSFPDPPPLVPA